MKNIEFKKSDLIIKKIKLAMALRYDSETDDCPIIIEKGSLKFAQKIKNIATKYNIPIISNKDITIKLYSNIKVGDFISEDFFKPVAEVLALVYKTKGTSNLIVIESNPSYDIYIKIYSFY